MKYIKKRIGAAVSILAVSLSLTLSGCQSSLFQTSDEKAKAYVDFVFNAASAGDEDAVYDLFSDAVKEEIGEEELRSQIRELFDFYQGTEILSKNSGVWTSDSNDYGVKRTDIRVFCTIETDAGDYRCALIYVARADEAPEEEGFTCIQAAEYETVDEDFYWADYNIYHGVFVFE